MRESHISWVGSVKLEWTIHKAAIQQWWREYDNREQEEQIGLTAPHQLLPVAEIRFRLQFYSAALTYIEVGANNTIWELGLVST